MVDAYKKLTLNQFEAALCVLNACIDRCPEPSWNAKVGNYAFCQVAFHTLFYADFYLGKDEDSFRRQPFHLDNRQFFTDYEEFQDRAPVLLYEKPAIKTYLQHVRDKASQAIAAETEDTLRGPPGFPRRPFTRAELHVYNIRHIQHHAAQLSLRLRLDANVDIPWVGTGWKNL